MQTAFNLVLSDRNVKAILVNIFAGINRCDWVAQGVVQGGQGICAMPLIVRLAGTNVEEGVQASSARCGLPIITADSPGRSGPTRPWPLRVPTCRPDPSNTLHKRPTP